MEPKSAMPEMRFIVVQIGYACFIAAVGRALRSADRLFLGTGLSSLESVLLPNILFFTGLIFMGVMGTRFRLGHRERGMGIGGMLLLEVGFCLVGASSFLLRTYLIYIPGILFGTGGALSFLAWVQVFAREGDRAKYELTSSALFSSIVALAMGAITELLHVVIVCLILLGISIISFWFVARSEVGAPEGMRQTSLSGRTPPGTFQRSLRSVWRPAFCVGVIGFITSTSRFLLAEHVPNAVIVVTMCGCIMGCLAVMVMLYEEDGHPSLNLTTVYKILFPANAILFLLLILFGDGYQAFQTGFAEFSFQICAIAMILQSIEYGKALKVQPFALYGLYSGIAHFILFWGYPLVFYASGIIDYAIYVIAAIVIYLISMSTMLFQREQKLHHAPFRFSGQDCESSAVEIGPSEPDTLTQVSSVNQELLALLEQRMRPENAGSLIPDQYNLSKRETEIFNLIIAGRNVPFIADVLYLSKNTVRTHIKNIYAKVDVHSRQELIDLVHITDSEDSE